MACEKTRKIVLVLRTLLEFHHYIGNQLVLNYNISKGHKSKRMLHMGRKINIMVTTWRYHWDNVTKTFYTKPLAPQVNIEDCEQLDTLFVKINDNRQIEHIYEGRISDVRIIGDKIYFNVNLKAKLDSPPPGIPLLKLTKSGWYIHELDEEVPQEDPYLPPFFKSLKTENDWEQFEHDVHVVLKLLGINNIRKFYKQRGHADGIFRIGNLVVIYDATLGDLKEKEKQIENYINSLRGDSYRFEQDSEWGIKNYTKHVWIIKRDENTRRFRISDDIVVKVVSIDSLMRLYKKRLVEIDDEDELVRRLIDIEKE